MFDYISNKEALVITCCYTLNPLFALTMRNEVFKIKYLGFALICAMFFCAPCLHAQEINPGDTTYDKWKHSIVHLESIYKREQLPAGNDTLTGTGFLLADHQKLYLVTAKHLIKSTLMGQEEQLANNAIYIRAYLDNVNKKFNISGASGKDVNSRAVAFTSDDDDIGIISLQKKEYKDIAAYLLAQGTTPIPIQLINVQNKHKANDWLFTYGYSVIKGIGKMPKLESVGMGICQIESYNRGDHFFTINHTVISPGSNGSPIIANDKLIGIISNASGILTNDDIIKQPLYYIKSARVIKASYILACLRKLQQMEANPAFNN